MRKRSPLILGLMRMNDVTVEELEELLFFAKDNGIDYLDVADVYSRGSAEDVLGQVFKLHPELRDAFFLQTKVGIVNKEGHTGYYDFSKEHIVTGFKESLQRLGLDHVDSLLLHRPDIFMDHEEVLSALRQLREEGLVQHFGVSNMDREQIEYLVGEDIDFEVDQLQLGLGQLSLVSSTFNVNLPSTFSTQSDGLFFYLKKRKMYLQCWSPFQFGLFEGSIFRHPAMANCRIVLNQLSSKYRVSAPAIALAFLLNLGENVEVIVGGLKKDYLVTAIQARNLRLEKEDWYRLYLSTGNRLP